MARTAARLLVVDDDAGIREMLTLALTERGYVVSTTDGRAAIDVAGHDLILLDARLGSRTARDLAAGGELEGGPPVLLMTALSELSGLATELGAAGAITKPFDLDDLVAAVERCLLSSSTGTRHARAGRRSAGGPPAG